MGVIEGVEKLPPSCKLALLGQVAGDCFGAPFEYHPNAPQLAELSAGEKRYLDNTTEVGVTIHRARIPGIYTDDTQQALALLFMRRLGEEDASFFRETMSLMSRWRVEGAEFGVHRGTGGNFRQAIQSGSPVATAGLGAAMRVGPVALTFDDLQEMVEWVLAVSSTTTTDPVGLACAARFATFVWAFGNPDRRDEIREVNWPTDQVPDMVWKATSKAIVVARDEGEEALLKFASSTGWANKKMKCAANGFGLTGLAWVMACVLKSKSFEDALVRVCASGGDTDTVAAMAGCLAALRNGSVPDWFIRELHPEARENILNPEEWDPVVSEQDLTAHEVVHRLSLAPQKKGKKKERAQVDFFAMAEEAMAEEDKAALEPVLFGGKDDPLEFACFSNFAAAPFELDGEFWPDTEHYYMAQKNPDDAEYQAAIRAAPTAFQAKKLGRQVELRDGWDEMKRDVMFRAVQAKFEQNPALRDRLLSTGERPIHENRMDPWWGGGPNYPNGFDWLGQVIMDVRDLLREDG